MMKLVFIDFEPVMIDTRFSLYLASFWVGRIIVSTNYTTNLVTYSVGHRDTSWQQLLLKDC